MSKRQTDRRTSDKKLKELSFTLEQIVDASKRRYSSNRIDIKPLMQKYLRLKRELNQEVGGPYYDTETK